MVRRAFQLVLKAPPEIVVYECPCRHTRQNPCQPTQVEHEAVPLLDEEDVPSRLVRG